MINSPRHNKPQMKNEAYYSTKEMLDKGWSLSLIKKYLPTPDKLTPNPHFSQGSPQKWFSKEKVDKISEEIQEILQRKIQRKPSLKISDPAKALEQEFMDFAHSIPIPQLSFSQLLYEVDKAWKYWSEIENVPFTPLKPWPQQDPLRDQLAFEYLIYRVITQYDAIIYDKSYAKNGGTQARHQFYAVIKNKIIIQYPYLSVPTTFIHIADTIP